MEDFIDSWLVCSNKIFKWIQNLHTILKKKKKAKEDMFRERKRDLKRPDCLKKVKFVKYIYKKNGPFSFLPNSTTLQYINIILTSK